MQRRAVSRGLGPEFFEQVRARNPIAERGIIVGVGNERGTAVAAIDHNGAAAESGEIGRGCKPGRTAADDEAVEA